MDPTWIAMLMSMFGGGAGAAGAAGAGAGGLAGALGGAGAAATAATAAPVAAAAPMAAEALPALSAAAPAAAGASFAAPAAPALGSGLYGVDSVVPGVMQMGAKGPMGMGPVAQGTGPLLSQGIPINDDVLSKLANAPIDPKLLLEMLKQGPDQGGGRQTKTVGGGGPSSVGQMGRLDTERRGERNTLSKLLGK